MKSLLVRMRVALRDWLNAPTAEEIAQKEADREEFARIRREVMSVFVEGSNADR